MPEAADQWDWLTSAKPAVAAGVLVLLWILESFAPMFLERGRRVSHDLANVSLGLLNAAIAAVIFGAAMLLVTEWARQQPLGLLHWLDAPAWVTWPLAIILFDGWMYGWHVLNHKVPLLWRFHAVHHSDREMDASSALRFHTGEIVLSGCGRLIVLPVLGMTMPQLLLYELLLQPVILFHHSNVHMPGRLDAMLRWLIVTPWMHWVHHSRWQPETDSNYASVLSIWDRIFGTFRLRAQPRQINLGLDEDRSERQWRTLWGMLARPFHTSLYRSPHHDKGNRR
jgi:sterol desaturase/sphingolipid hydroxylase (fatty acid hydroxylase superfamily)